MRKALKMLPWILAGWFVIAAGLGIIIGKAIDMADEIELGDVDDAHS